MKAKQAMSLGISSGQAVENMVRHADIREKSTTTNIEYECELPHAVCREAVRSAVGMPDLMLPSEDDFSVFSCGSALIHTDTVIRDITIGVIMQGNHELYIGPSKRTRVPLVPGTVFMLNNKVMHGAQRLSDTVDSLIFATIDLFFESTKDAMTKLGLWG